jgi:hypothetical protein
MVDYRGVGIAAFSINILFIGMMILFFCLNHKSKSVPNSILDGAVSQRYYYIGAGLLICATFIIELLLLILKEPTDQVRLSAFDLMAMAAWVYFSMTIYMQDKRYMHPQWKSGPQVVLYVAWGLSLIIIGLNLAIFFGIK